MALPVGQAFYAMALKHTLDVVEEESYGKVEGGTFRDCASLEFVARH